MKRLLGLLLASSALAAPARAQEMAPVVVSPPPAPDGPGDEEAKADFQQARVLPDRSPLTWAGRYGLLGLYGFGELDALHDSTQSFGAGTNNFTLVHPGTYAANTARDQLTICDSRLGARASTAPEGRLRFFFLLELGPDFRQTDWDGPARRCGLLRVRHLYFGMRTPIVDVLVGRYYSLFGWGGKGLLPNTAAFMGVAGQVYDLESQVRLSHIFRFEFVDFEIAGAIAGKSADGRTGWTSLELGVRFALTGWNGASAQGGGPPTVAPLQVGISSVGRVIAANKFVAMPGEPERVNGGGLAFDAFVPILLAHGDDLTNALSGTLELTSGSGLADMYTGLTGGVLFPALPNASDTGPAPVYMPGIQPGIITSDQNLDLRTVNWRTLVVGAQYHLPFARGRRVWVSALGSRTWSNNTRVLTPPPRWGGTWQDGRYFDANVFVAVTRAFQLALSGQVTRQTLNDGAIARNTRAQLAAAYFF